MLHFVQTDCRTSVDSHLALLVTLVPENGLSSERQCYNCHAVTPKSAMTETASRVSQRC